MRGCLCGTGVPSSMVCGSCVLGAEGRFLLVFADFFYFFPSKRRCYDLCSAGGEESAREEGSGGEGGGGEEGYGEDTVEVGEGIWEGVGGLA